jgi:hypothetical protein
MLPTILKSNTRRCLFKVALVPWANVYRDISNSMAYETRRCNAYPEPIPRNDTNVHNLKVSPIVTLELTNFAVGLGVTCSPRGPRFADSKPTEVDGFFQGVKILNTSSQGGTLSWGSRVWDFRLVKEPQSWKNRPLSKL